MVYLDIRLMQLHRLNNSQPVAKFTKPRADTVFERKALLRACSANVPKASIDLDVNCYPLIVKMLNEHRFQHRPTSLNRDSSLSPRVGSS